MEQVSETGLEEPIGTVRTLLATRQVRCCYGETLQLELGDRNGIVESYSFRAVLYRLKIFESLTEQSVWIINTEPAQARENSAEITDGWCWWSDSS